MSALIQEPQVEDTLGERRDENPYNIEIQDAQAVNGAKTQVWSDNIVTGFSNNTNDKQQRNVPSKADPGTRPFICHVCRTSFTRLENLKRHMNKHQRSKKFRCHICNKEFSRNDTLRLHRRKTHPEEYKLLTQDTNQKKVIVQGTENQYVSQQVKELKQEPMLRSFSDPTIEDHPMGVVQALWAVQEEEAGSPSFLHANFQDNEIEVILQNYWTHFHPFFPLIHRPTFDRRTANRILVSSMCAVGALYMPLLRQHSAILCESALKSINGVLYCTDVSIDIVRASLILTFYGIYTNKIWYKRSRALHTQLVAVARETGIFQINPLDKFDDEWSSFIASEGRKRTSCCLYMVDGQMATLLNYPPSLSHYEVKHVLPCSDELWEAGSAFEWRKIYSSNLSKSQGIHFLQALQQTLMYGRCPKHMSSFGSLTILTSIHIMIRNMAQYSGVLEVPAINANDPFSRKSQLGAALNALRWLIPKKRIIQASNRQHDMWDMFVATWNLAYIHLHVPDPVITSGIVEITLPATIATAAALAKPYPIHSPGNSILSNNFKFISYETLSVVVNHVCYFLKSSAHLRTENGVEKSPVFTFMFYKASLVAWQVLNSGLYGSLMEEEDKFEKRLVENDYIMRRLIDDIMNCMEDEESDDSDVDELEKFERWTRNVLSSACTWSVGIAASASFFF